MVQKARLGDVLLDKGVITEKQLAAALEEQKAKGGFLGQILIEKGFASSEDITHAMGELTTTKSEEGSKWGDALVAGGLITPEQLQKAQEKQAKTHQHLSQILAELGYVTPEQIAQAIGRHWDVPYVSLTGQSPNPEVMQLLTEDIMRRYTLVPLELRGDVLVIAMSDPLNILAIDEVKLLTNCQIDIRIATERDISLLVDKQYSIKTVAKEAVLGMKSDDLTESLKQKEAAYGGRMGEGGPRHGWPQISLGR